MFLQITQTLKDSFNISFYNGSLSSFYVRKGSLVEILIILIGIQKRSTQVESEIYKKVKNERRLKRNDKALIIYIWI